MGGGVLDSERDGIGSSFHARAPTVNGDKTEVARGQCAAAYVEGEPGDLGAGRN